MVSVIIPYNEDRGYLKECVASIEAQTYPDIELIPSFSPGSCGHNFNNGLEKATGEYVKWVDEDDWLPPDSIENLVNGIGQAPWICANSWDVVQHDSVPFEEHTKILKSVFNFEDNS